MILLHHANADGLMVFELRGTDADLIMTLFHLPLQRRSANAGIFVTLRPRDLTDAEFAETVGEGGGDSQAIQLEWPDAVRLPEGRV